MREAYFLGNLTDQVLRENVARRRGEADLSQRVRYEDLRNPTDTQKYAGLLVFALELTATPTRTEVAELTRAFNRASYHLPVLLLLRYPALLAPHTTRLALAASERGPYMQTWRAGEKVGKISILYDINPAPEQLHAGHERLLERLKVPGDIQTLEALSNYWNAVLNVQLLNKDFYRELSNWYFWAIRQVKTPAYDGDQGDDVRNATAMIRLITRLIFTWFLKEKHLVPDGLFEQDYVYGKLLKPATEDPHGSTYYKAVLQNLFFATLNTEMRDQDGQPNRVFRPSKRNERNQNAAYGEAGFLRYEALFTTSGKALALELFNHIPFLNGGLFECLDPTPKAKETRQLIDCFSDANQDKMSVPDELFFGSERVMNLAGEYGDMARKREKVRGLLRILKGYTFTITENTPLEEEVALDPELLGKVFENLLAAYNPETQTTARKQTGSFYTPREVVEYMVDESLLAYLRPYLPTGTLPAPTLVQTVDQPNQNLFGQTIPQQATLNLTPPAGPAPVAPDAEAALRSLLANPDLLNPFDDATTGVLIQALDQLKLLDPACGSGAFPMGALQRLSYLLARLDPSNDRWKQQQIERALAPIRDDLRKLGTLSDAQIRTKAEEMAKQRIKEIEETFSDAYQLDYARKLYFIENCLYGVDLQPIAVQITKLRCFIALLVEQKGTGNHARQAKNNLGILPLPNLETKFVAANTLLQLEAAGGQQSAVTERAQELQAELRRVRHDYFTVRSRKKKLELKAQDETIRESLRRELQFSLNGPDAQRLATWNPYDLRESAAFFSPAWMLGVDTGFDVVIGNPPYVRQEKFTGMKPALQKHYPGTYTGTADLYVYFYDRSLQALRPGGILCFITSNKFYRAGYGNKLRAMLTNSTTLLSLIDFGDAPVFDAIAYPTILLTQKAKPTANHTARTLVWEPGPSIEQFPTLFAEKSFPLPQQTLTADGWQFEEATTRNLLTKMRNAGKPLTDYVKGRFYRGILTGLNDAFVVDAATRRELIKADKRSAELLKPYLRGRDVKRWRVNDTGLWLIFTRRGTDIDKYPAIKQHLAQYQHQLTPGISGGRKPGSYKWFDIQDNVAYWQEFEQPKIIIPAITKGASYALDTTGFYTNDKTSICVADKPMYLLGLLNSRLLEWQIEQTAATKQGGFLEFKPMYVTQLPIVKAPQKEEQEIERLVAKILAAKAANSEADTLQMEQQIDEIVFDLYGLTEEEKVLVQGAEA
ncbi:Eco57I restriction-modification methylase domain-containing protein [Hymenobacter guriensis]|uniref:site-specific DNA-methyltransferase (adenine-specific) n=1 Tax=Hymenobacter guriensis TaxID=2793065 RepID=A0ABS0L1Z0_9BACT|nr:TaqI-like C-terminal specificity domain-containing protein [Hymenobacter guriensis]MBG8553995.1 Eco57I restriction-modification methylase domain-containing protein [Hymenobacter guriensis]